MPGKTSDCPRKIKKKVGEKKKIAREKNQEKYQKTFSRALLIFSCKKKMLFSLPGSKSAREKVISTRENSGKYGRENDFCTREKKSKKPESAREK